VPERYRLHAAPPRASQQLSEAAGNGRGDIREPTFVVAALIFAWDLHAPLPCTVRDLSRSGARIELDYHGLKPPKGHIALPQRLMLHLCPLRTTFACRLTWREGRHFGVEFIHKCADGRRRRR
jgi:hypothetical protein